MTKMRKLLVRFIQVVGLLFALSFMGAVANPPSDNPWFHVRNFWIDEQNISTLASDRNNCTSQSKPCLTTNQVFYRLGGLYPTLPSGDDITFHEMSAVTLPIDFHPCTNAAITFEGVMTQVGSSCILSAVTNRNTASTVGTQLTATASCITAPGQFVMNATHVSNTFSKATSGGGVWTLTQALQPCTVDTITCNRIEVNNWANGDTITVWTMPQLNIDWVGTSCGQGGAFVGFQHIAFNGPHATVDGPFAVIWEDMQTGGSVY